MRFIISIFLFFLGFGCCLAQDSTVNLSTAMFDANQVIELAKIDGWIFRQGNDPVWAGTEINTSGWEKIKPGQVTKKLADRNRKIEGWFRVKIKLDSSFGDMPIYLGEGGWAASDMYVDGSLFRSYGNTGTNGKAYKEYHPGSKEFVNPIQLTINTEHIIAIHFVIYVPVFPLYLILHSGALSTYPMLSGPALIPNVYDFKKVTTTYYGVCIGALVLIQWIY